MRERKSGWETSGVSVLEQTMRFDGDCNCNRQRVDVKLHVVLYPEQDLSLINWHVG